MLGRQTHRAHLLAAGIETRVRGQRLQHLLILLRREELVGRRIGVAPEPFGKLGLGKFAGGEAEEDDGGFGLRRRQLLPVQVEERAPTTTKAVRLFPSTNGWFCVIPQA